MFSSKSKKTVWEKFPELKKVPVEKFPNHVLLIPDGNGRWAKLAKKNIDGICILLTENEINEIHNLLLMAIGLTKQYEQRIS